MKPRTILIAPYSRHEDEKGGVQIFNGFDHNIRVRIEKAEAEQVILLNGTGLKSLVISVLLFFVLTVPAYAATYATWYGGVGDTCDPWKHTVTASGERFDETLLTCALPKRGFGKAYKITNLRNGKSVVVRHNDYGPGKGPRKRGVGVDLTKKAFSQIADLREGRIPIKVEAVG